MTKASDERCDNCLFYRPGACHQLPPVRLPRKFDDRATAGNRVRDESMSWGWPCPNDWCGQWSPVVEQHKARR